jgi:hypothetical protein
MKYEAKSSQSRFDVHRISTPRAMALAVVLASAATVLLNAAINAELGARLPTNTTAPALNTRPHAPAYSTPRAVPVRHITQAEARL